MRLVVAKFATGFDNSFDVDGAIQRIVLLFLLFCTGGCGKI